MRLAMTWNDATRRFSIALAPGSRLRGTLPRTFEVRVAGAEPARTLTFNGQLVSATL
jgi:hypothetical protein